MQERLYPRGFPRTHEDDPVRPRKHTTSPAHLLRNSSSLAMLSLMPLVRIDTRSLSPPQGGQIRTNVVVGLAGVSRYPGTHLRHPSIISRMHVTVKTQLIDMLSDGDGGCHVKVRAPASGGFNGATRLPLHRRNAADLYRASWWHFRDSHLSMPRL